jgi:hypothetical protein
MDIYCYVLGLRELLFQSPEKIKTSTTDRSASLNCQRHSETAQGLSSNFREVQYQ